MKSAGTREHLLADHYQQLDVHVGRARFEQGRGITDLRRRDRRSRSRRRAQPMLAIDEMFLACQTRLDEVVVDQAANRTVVVRRPYLRAVWRRDGRWNIQSLFPLPKFSDQTPEMRIEDATLVLEDASRPSCAPLTIRGIDISSRRSIKVDRHHRLRPARAFKSKVQSPVPARELRFAGQIGRDDGSLDIVLEARGPGAFARVAGGRARFARPTVSTELTARADVTLRLSRAGGGTFR